MSARPFAGPAPVFALFVSVLVGVCTFVYRFNQLGGTLGGFENDHFVQLSTARQIVAGDLPFRDYNEIGAPLTTLSSAVGQMIGGHALLPDALLTMGLIAAGTAVACWLAARASGSTLLAAVLTLVLAALAPRPYAYPKVLVYAMGILAAWRYVDRPSAGRAAVMAVVIAVSFLFRHDHGAYLGLFSVLTILAVHGWNAKLALPRSVLVTALCILLLLPFFVFMQVNGGIVEYFRKAMVYAERDAERTSFIPPRLEYGSSEPLVRIEPVPQSAQQAEINVRWAPSVSAAMRIDREQKYSLRNAELREGRTWGYVLADTSTHNIAALVRDNQVEDTHGVDRTRFTLSTADAEGSALSRVLARVRLAPELTSRANALAWLYYLFVLLAPTAAMVAWVRWRGAAQDRVDLPYMLPVIVLMVILSVTLLSRGATAIRLPDASAPLAAVSAWLFAVATARPRTLAARLTGREHLLLAARRLACVLLLVITAGAAAVLGDVRNRFDAADFDGGAAAAWQRTRHVARELAASPPLRGITDLDHPGSLRLAEYVNRCTGPADRVFILGNYPEVYFFAGRPFAGSHVWLVPGFYSSDRDQQTIIDRLQQWPVPIVVTEPAAEYDGEYRRYFPRLTTFLDQAYRDVGTIPFGDIQLRVLVNRQARPSSTYMSATGAPLPCFATSRTFHASATTP